jgi:diguanylate cyclase (GGDEF)-like protein
LDFWNKATLRSLLIPNSLVLLAAIVLLESRWIVIPASIVTFFYYAVFATGMLLAWRFHSSRVLFALFVLLLSETALELFSAPHQEPATSRIAFEAIAFLLPFNLLFLGWLPERGLATPMVASRLLAIFLECVFVAVLCRPGQQSGFVLFNYPLLNPNWFHWTKIPQPALLTFVLTCVLLLLRFLEIPKPVESGFLWALMSSFLALHVGGIGRVATAYIATAALLLLVAIIETSYSMAFHDELTGLPARRAFNQALLALEDPYTVAIVDIDHFKQFNDTYGHDTGDQVLRLVAGKLAQVTGGGKPFRCGGEEFAIVFPGMSLKEAMHHVEEVRISVENSAFHIRGADRRYKPRKTDRRTATVRKGRVSRAVSAPGPRSRRAVSVTVSIGVAEPTAKIRDTEKVIAAADKALYLAKANGRNRVEAANSVGSFR